MESVWRKSSPFVGALRFAAVLLATAALLASAGCEPEKESCDCSCDGGKVCAPSHEGRTGCASPFMVLLPCSPSHCCDYCCDP